MRDEREIADLTREGNQYLAAGMLDRVELVNEQLRLRDADTIALPAVKPKQTRTSTQAATRRKAKAS